MYLLLIKYKYTSEHLKKQMLMPCKYSQINCQAVSIKSLDLQIHNVDNKCIMLRSD